MIIYCMSDIHGCLNEFKDALSLIRKQLDKPDTMLVFLGDYIHYGPDGRGVIDRIMQLQQEIGKDRLVAILGNHEEAVIDGFSGIDNDNNASNKASKENDKNYIEWFKTLPRYYVNGNTIFTHAGIDEEAGEDWKWGTGDHIFTGKYPADIGQIPDLEMKVVAGHIGTASISGDPAFHDIYFDGASHYYIDGSVTESGVIPVLMVDTDKDKYYRVTKNGNVPIRPYCDKV